MSMVAPQWFKDAVKNWRTQHFIGISNDGKIVDAGGLGLWRDNDYAGNNIVRKVTSTINPEGVYGVFYKYPWSSQLLGTSFPFKTTAGALPSLDDGFCLIMTYVVSLEYEAYAASHVGAARYASLECAYGSIEPRDRVGAYGILDAHDTNDRDFYYPPSGDLSRFSAPEAKCLVLAANSSGDVVIGDFHPKFAEADSRVHTYTEINHISNFEELSIHGYCGSGLGISSVQLLVGSAGADLAFDLSFDGGGFWSSHHGTQELGIPPKTDKYGFPR